MCVPILASLDLGESADFYTRYLGFRFERHADYLLARRDGMEIHFWLAADRIHPEHTACYIRGGQVVALYDEFRNKNVPGLSDFKVRPWNMKEFHIIDPHGNLLRFGCAPEEVGD
jgi:catechol 2,3-dioxygenase-like lactoylglutathione lyase family enzyme